jgi:hypothetical protein
MYLLAAPTCLLHIFVQASIKPELFIKDFRRFAYNAPFKSKQSLPLPTAPQVPPAPHIPGPTLLQEQNEWEPELRLIAQLSPAHQKQQAHSMPYLCELLVRCNGDVSAVVEALATRVCFGECALH